MLQAGAMAGLVFMQAAGKLLNALGCSTELGHVANHNAYFLSPAVA